MKYEEALAIARENKSNIDHCRETTKGFIFTSKEDEKYEGGAGHTPVVILKKDGKPVPMPFFVISGTGTDIREFDVK